MHICHKTLREEVLATDGGHMPHISFQTGNEMKDALLEMHLHLKNGHSRTA